jgi:hypothetical protein
LVNNGQLYFANGGLVQNDEACTYYEDIIDQMTLGHIFLLREFNFTPSVGWSLDPFGHSRTNAYIASKMGFKSLFFSRIDHEEQLERLG